MACILGNELMRRIKTSVGFTVVELMIALAVAAILLGVAVPSFINLLNNNKLSTVSSQIVSTLQGARERAVSMDETVSISQTANAITCTYTIEGVQQNCESFSVSDHDITIKADNNTPDNNTFTFSPSGQTQQELQFVVQHSDVSSHRFLIRIFNSGRISVKQKPIEAEG